MNAMAMIAYRLHSAAAALLVLMGLAYLLRRRFMPYHAVALNQRWEDLDDPTRTLILASMRIIGSAWLAIAVALFILLRNGFRSGLPWAVYGVPAIGLAVALPTLMTVLYVKTHTRASPPWPVLAVTVALFAAGLLLSLGAAWAG
jgi:hypothetical protein